MSTETDNNGSLLAEIVDLRLRLMEAEETLSAIRGGEVDALVIGDQVYTLESADAASNRFRGEVLAQINEAVVAVDNEMHVTYMNPAAERQYDVSASEVLGRKLDVLYQYRWTAKEDEATAWSELETNGFWRGENVHIKPNGDEIYVESTVNVLRDSEGRGVGLLAIIRDIHERKHADLALRASEHKLSLIYDNSPDSLYLVAVEPNDQFRFLSVNETFLQITGYEKEQVEGVPIEQVIQRDNIDLVRSKYREVLQTSETVTYEEMARLPSGTMHGEISLTPILGPGDKITHILGVIRDVTARKDAEEALRRAHDQLETRVIERTQELARTNAALEKEMREHLVAESQKAELARKVVTTQEDERRRIARDLHDQLGQRVTALRLQLASIVDEVGTDGQLFHRIKSLQEVAELLDSELGFLAWELRPATLDELGFSQAAGAFLDEWSRHYGIRADLHLAGFADRRLDGDTETHLYRIMQEALNNVAKHAQAEQVNVLLKCNGSDVTMIVEDNGKGFDLSKKKVSRRSGKGLGLLGMRERAMLVGGDVQLESSAGTGTTVFVRVPNV